jgi:acetyl-CoA carboxylase carboxyltransferase component
MTRHYCRRYGSIFLAGSYLVKAAIGETIDNETLGGADYTLRNLWCYWLQAKDDKDALDKIKNIVDKIGDYNTAGFSRVKAENQL